MAVGDVIYASNTKKSVCLMAAGTTANTGQPTDGAIDPTALGAGIVANYPRKDRILTPDAADGASFPGYFAEQSTLCIDSTAGSGTMVGTFTLWGFLVGPNKWYPVAVNGAAAIAELASPGDTIRYTQQYTNLGHWDYLFLQLAAVGGTATAFEAWLTTAKQGM